MRLSEENIRLIFGLKLNQLRQEQEYTLSELSDRSGLSISYITEIEKGKKYPKPEKLAALANALEVPYDELVSLKLTKNLAPIGDLLQTNILNLLPLDFFGIEIGKLIDLVSKVPAKLGAFIKTFVELARNYQVRQEHLYFAVLRSYQEIHDNYFEEIESAADKFAKENGLAQNPPVQAEVLESILKEKYEIRIEETDFENAPELIRTRSIFIPGKGKKQPTLIINSQLNPKQKAFIFGRELGFQALEIKERPLTFSWVEVNSFEELHNNFLASYFSSALILHRQTVVTELKTFFSESTFQPDILVSMMDRYNASPEMFFYRLTSLLPKYFNIRNLFFLRFNSRPKVDKYHLTKELHLNQQHTPQGNQVSDHYCRRWITIKALKELEESQQKSKNVASITTGAQISEYIDTDNAYLCISVARPLFPTPDLNSVVTLGFLMNTEFKRKVKFWNDEAIPRVTVNSTCESCPIQDCEDRAAPAWRLRDELSREAKQKAFENFLSDFE